MANVKRLIGLLRDVQAIEQQIIDALDKGVNRRPIAEVEAPTPEVLRKRNDRDAGRRDQITQASKKINSLRAAMGS